MLLNAFFKLSYGISHCKIMKALLYFSVHFLVSKVIFNQMYHEFIKKMSRNAINK